LQARQTGGPIACLIWPTATFYDTHIIENIDEMKIFNRIFTINQSESLNIIPRNQTKEVFGTEKSIENF